MFCIVVFLQVCLCLLPVLSLPFRFLFSCASLCPFLWGDFVLKTCPLCALVTRLTSLAPPRQILFLVVFWLFGRAHTSDHGHSPRALPHSRAPNPIYSPLHPFASMDAHKWAYTDTPDPRLHAWHVCVFCYVLLCVA